MTHETKREIRTGLEEKAQSFPQFFPKRKNPSRLETDFVPPNFLLFQSNRYPHIHINVPVDGHVVVLVSTY